jgi:enamine deaminase RidA (YjgF/YER057c/UK114 family)
MSQKKRIAINPPGVFPPGGQYSYAVKAGGFLFVAGQTATSPEGTLVGEGDASAQTRQVFKNIGRILEGAGASFADVVEFTTYLVGVESVGPFLETRLELFPALYPNRDYPTNTLINVESLAGSKALVEIKTVAVAPESG